MKRLPAKPLPPVSCIATVNREGGHVFLRVQVNAGAIVIKHRALDALDVAEKIRDAVSFAKARAQRSVELELPSGEGLTLTLDTASAIADELTTGASRASGVRA